MADDTWKAVRGELGDEHLELGPYFAQQALHSPRHLLFTLARYKFAAKLLPVGRTVDVLELGCGEGLGTMMLAERAGRTLGVDFDEDAIRHAQSTLGRDGIEFAQADFLGTTFGTFGAVVSLDVIEHIEQPLEGSFFQTVVANVAPDGFAVIGTPNQLASQYASPASEIGHVNLFTAERLAALAQEHFTNVFLFGANDEVVHTGFFPMCHYLLALCTGPRR
jgi:2-polyprenyl-3-methyl-5-hydroxy-6-metoxy-1,4-benzoquinol methylase